MLFVLILSFLFNNTQLDCSQYVDLKSFAVLNLERYSKYWSFYHSRYRYYTSRDEYYAGMITEKKPNQLLSLYNCQVAGKTDQPLQFNGLSFGTSPQNITREIGRPKYSWRNPTFRAHQVKVHRLNIQHISCYVVLHFLNNRLFVIDAVFKKLSHRNTDRVLTILNHKYVSSNEYDLLEGISDPDNNFLLLEHNHYLSMKYVSGDTQFRAILANALQKKQERRVSFEVKLNTVLAEYL